MTEQRRPSVVIVGTSIIDANGVSYRDGSGKLVDKPYNKAAAAMVSAMISNLMPVGPPNNDNDTSDK